MNTKTVVMRSHNIEELKRQIEELKRQVQLKQLKIDSLLEVTASINSNYSANALFKIYEFILMAEIGRLVLWHKNHDWKCVCQYGISKSIVRQISITRDLLIYDGKEPIYLTSADSPALVYFDLLIPIYHKNEPLAFVLLGKFKNDFGKGETLAEKTKFIQTISNIIIVAIENKRLFRRQLEQERLKKELEVAEQVQTMLIPKVLPHNKIIEMAAIYKPHHSISGDYYDYIPLDRTGNEFLVCMADVSGKGMAAALLMANFQAVLRALAKETKDLKALIAKLNARLMEVTHGDKFITLFLAKHQLNTRTFTYINAGHNPPLMITPNQNVMELNRGATILGAFEQLPFIHETTLTLDPDTVIITYTDGLTDVEDESGDYYEMERFTDFTRAHAHLPMADFNQKLIEQLEIFKGRTAYTDDISILSYRIF